METCLLPLGAQTLAQVYQGWARSMKSLRKKKKIALTKGNPESHVHLESGRLGLKLKLGEGGCGVATGGTGGSGFSSAARAEA